MRLICNFRRLRRALLSVAFFSLGLHAAEIKGVVLDPPGNPIPGAQVAAVNALGIITRQVTDDRGIYDLYISPLYENVQLRAAAPGYATVVSPPTAVIRLSLAPRIESVRAATSNIDTIPAQQGTEVSVVTGDDLRNRDEAQAVDLLRTLPGMVISQSGARGSTADLFVRGGDPAYNLVLLDDVPLNGFYGGGLFDFAHISADAVEEAQVARGPQSAVYGSYALGSVVNFETRSPANGPALDVLAEGGTHDENRDSLSGETMFARGWGVAGSFSSLLSNGPVTNNDYRNDNGLLALDHRWRTNKISFFGDFDSNNVGEPGPYGSNPLGLFPGLNKIARSKNNTSNYGVHYNGDLTDKLRLDVIGGVYWNNNLETFPTGPGSSPLFDKDLNANGELRATYTISKMLTMTAGVVVDREETRDTVALNAAGSDFLLRRDAISEYLETRMTIRKLYINLGLRAETYMTPLIPGDLTAVIPRPDFPAQSDTEVSPRLSGSYLIRPTTRIHASYGTGIRPPGGAAIVFTNNPALLPEHVQGYDAGIEETLFASKLSLDATWFHNRYRDLIVSLGGPYGEFSPYATGNLGTARAEGIETSAQLRPTRWLSLTAGYTWLESDVLSLEGSTGMVAPYFYLGEPLLRRPKQSGSFVATLRHGRADVNLVGSWRGHTLDAEPNQGVSAGLFVNPGYQDLGINVNYRVHGKLTAYTNLHNALDQRYEEIFGYPAPLLNVVLGLKWSLAGSR